MHSSTLSGLALSLLLFSTVLHATWNLMIRGQGSKASFVERAISLLASFGFLPAVISEMTSRSIPWEAWGYLVLSGASCAVYYLFLVQGYEASDFAVVYPVARALPVLMVACSEGMMGKTPSLVGWMGISLVVVGCLVAPLKSLAEIRLRAYWNRATLFMVLAALGTVGYTLSDKAASGHLMQSPGTAFRYCYFYFFFTYLWYKLVLRLPGLPDPKAYVGSDLLPGLAGAFTFLAYGLIIWCYQIVERASTVVAFRQFSIVIGVVAAFLLFPEERKWIRLAASAGITVGLAVIALSKG